MCTSLPLDRALTPSNIPLPDSRPPTPPAELSRTASPAAVGSVGAPPPLPRRAATRGVRGTAAASVSRSGTPVNGLESASKKAHTVETEDIDIGQYVGDDSWEEKTWKELVRLREDMFWARLGGIRG